MAIPTAELVTPRQATTREGADAIVLRLDPHLAVLSQGLGLPEPIAQLTLFPVLGLKMPSDLNRAELHGLEGKRTKTSAWRNDDHEHS